MKNPKILRCGYRYEIRPRSRLDDYGHFHYVIPAHYADGCDLGDCWLVDLAGNVHPGYNVSPIPFCASSLRNGVPLPPDFELYGVSH